LKAPPSSVAIKTIPLLVIDNMYAHLLILTNTRRNNMDAIFRNIERTGDPKQLYFYKIRSGMPVTYKEFLKYNPYGSPAFLSRKQADLFIDEIYKREPDPEYLHDSHWEKQSDITHVIRNTVESFSKRELYGLGFNEDEILDLMGKDAKHPVVDLLQTVPSETGRDLEYLIRALLAQGRTAGYTTRMWNLEYFSLSSQAKLFGSMTSECILHDPKGSSGEARFSTCSDYLVWILWNEEDGIQVVLDAPGSINFRERINEWIAGKDVYFRDVQEEKYFSDMEEAYEENAKLRFYDIQEELETG